MVENVSNKHTKTNHNPMNATHTPGPWTLFDLDEENPGCRWSIVKGGPLAYLHTEPCDQGQANARLIAAAPELLAALEGAERVLSCKTVHVDEITGEALSPLMIEIRAAIAKAKQA